MVWFIERGTLMTGFEIFIVCGFVYCVADFILGIAFKRCILPGLKCRTCKR